MAGGRGEHGRAGEGQGRAGQGRAGQGRTGQGRAGGGQGRAWNAVSRAGAGQGKPGAAVSVADGIPWPLDPPLAALNMARAHRLTPDSPGAGDWVRVGGYKWLSFRKYCYISRQLQHVMCCICVSMCPYARAAALPADRSSAEKELAAVAHPGRHKEADEQMKSVAAVMGGALAATAPVPRCSPGGGFWRARGTACRCSGLSASQPEARSPA